MLNKEIKDLLRATVVGTLPIVEEIRKRYGADSVEYRQALHEYNKMLDVVDEIPDEADNASEA
jgi:hypothetical protein